MNPPTFKSPTNVSSLINNNDVPPASNSESPPLIKRKRLTQACDACRKKKVKCSGEKPSCNNCSRLGTQCTYLPSTRKRGPRVGLVESLEKRLQQMEKLLQPLKEQGLVEGFDDNMDDDDNDYNNISKSSTGGYPTKKPRLNSKDSESSAVSDIPFSRFSLDDYNKPPQFIPSQKNQFHQQSPATYTNNNNINNNLNSQNEFNLFHRKDSNDQNNDKKINNPVSTNGKEEDELIYFGKSSIVPGFRHHSETMCRGGAPDSPTISERSSQSGSTNSEEHTPILPILKSTIFSSEYNIPSDIIEHLASCFFRYVDIQMSMFHESTFKKQLRQKKISPFLVLSMCAVSSRYATHPSVARNPPYLAGEHFSAAANRMILQSFDVPSVECVQAFVLLALHMFGTCRGPRAWMYIGMAVRMAQEIGLHKIDEANLNMQVPKNKSEAALIQKETRRRTFWSCFLLDRYSACAVGRPTLIDEDDCDVRLPCNEAIWNYDHPYSKSLIDNYFNETQVKQDSRLTLTNNGLCACFVSATALLGRATQFVNRSKPSNSLPPWDPQSKFFILSNEIDMWYKSLSPHYAYNKERLGKLMANGTGVMFSLLHLIYYAAIIVLNRPHVAILQSNEAFSDPQHFEFMRSSAQRCSEAAKIIVSMSADILQHGHECFSPFTVYPLFVSTTILINDCYSSNITVAQEAEKNLAAIQEYLTTMGPYWAMGNKFLRVINEMRKSRAEQNEKKEEKSNNNFSNSNIPDSLGEMSTSTDAGLLTYWNRAPIETNINVNNLTSIILPEEFSSPRWFGNANDSFMSSNDTFSSLLRSPPFTPRTLSRLSLVKKDKNSNEENSTTGNDYFSQNSFNYSGGSGYPAPVFDGYSMLNMPYQSVLDFDIGRDISLLNRPVKHWTSINVEGTSTNPNTSTTTTT